MFMCKADTVPIAFARKDPNALFPIVRALKCLLETTCDVFVFAFRGLHFVNHCLGRWCDLATSPLLKKAFKSPNSIRIRTNMR